MRAIALVVALVAVNGFSYVDVPSPAVKQLPRERVLEACAGHSGQGCTQFREAALLCECLAGADGWRIDASVRAIPSVFVEKLSWVRHEMGHIADFRHFLRAHVSALGERRFDSLQSCERYTRAALDAFPTTLQRIARISGDRRDGQAAATSEDHLVVVKAEVMPQLVNDRLANLANDLPAASGNAQNRTAKDGDLVRQRGQHVVASFRQANPAENPKQLVVRGSVSKDVAVFVSRLFFDDNDDVVEKSRELFRQFVQSLFDELFELRSA
jgi:hypothetical protein